jgi:hypothetical protein
MATPVPMAKLDKESADALESSLQAVLERNTQLARSLGHQ